MVRFDRSVNAYVTHLVASIVHRRDGVAVRGWYPASPNGHDRFGWWWKANDGTCRWFLGRNSSEVKAGCWRFRQWCNLMATTELVLRDRRSKNTDERDMP